MTNRIRLKLAVFKVACWKIARNKIFLQLCALYFITFLLVLPMIGINLKHSAYFRKKKNFEENVNQMKEQNTERLKWAELALTSNEKLVTNKDVSFEIEDIVITVITVSRNRHEVDDYEPKYLTQLVAHFLSKIPSAKRNNFRPKITVCNVDKDPQTYLEAEDIVKKLNIKTFKRYENEKPSDINIFEKEKQDYVYCLNQSLEFNKPKYILLVEDDALPHEDIFDVLRNVLKYHLGSQVDDMLYLKLYHPERLLGYLSLEPDRIPELIAIGFTFGTVFTLIYANFVRELRCNTSGAFKVVWLVMIIYCILIAVVFGRQNLSQLRRVSPHLYTISKASSCCTPAMMFTTHGAKELVNYLNSTQCKEGYAKDTAMEDLWKISSLKPYQLDPNLFTHIGMYSSLRKKILDPFIV